MTDYSEWRPRRSGNCDRGTRTRRAGGKQDAARATYVDFESVKKINRALDKYLDENGD